MDVTVVIQIIVGVVTGGGLLEFFRWLSVRKAEKKSAYIDVRQKEHDLQQDKASDVISM